MTAPPDDSARRVRDRLHADELSGKWEWSRQLEERLGVLEWRSRWALRILSAALAGLSALSIYARDAIIGALEQRGEARILAHQAAEEIARARQRDADIAQLQRALERLRGRIEGSSLRGPAPRNPDKDDTP
jgi:hypothetical protein